MTIREVTPDEAEAYRALRLRALADHPTSFVTTPDECPPLDEWVKRLTPTDPQTGWNFGSFMGDKLVGMMYFGRETRTKIRHRGFIGAMYVAPEGRGQGFGAGMIRAAIEVAEGLGDLDYIRLAVETKNSVARKLYANMGFQHAFYEENYLKIGNQYYDLEWMIYPLGERT